MRPCGIAGQWSTSKTSRMGHVCVHMNEHFVNQYTFIQSIWRLNM